MTKLCLFPIFLSLFYVIWSVFAIESAYREDRAAKFFCSMLAGDSVLDHCSCRGTRKVNVKMITSETKIAQKLINHYLLKALDLHELQVNFFYTFVLSQHF